MARFFLLSWQFFAFGRDVVVGKQEVKRDRGNTDFFHDYSVKLGIFFIVCFTLALNFLSRTE